MQLESTWSALDRAGMFAFELESGDLAVILNTGQVMVARNANVLSPDQSVAAIARYDHAHRHDMRRHNAVAVPVRPPVPAGGDLDLDWETKRARR